MDIEIRRNRDVTFSLTAPPPEAVMEWFQIMAELSDEARRQQEEFDASCRKFEEDFWAMVKKYPERWIDLDGNQITRETHEMGFDYGEPDEKGICTATVMWVRPKKSEYEKWPEQYNL
ncbi:MAG: hypothetical protein IJP77_06085 [Bacteroidales bacterium]|nr:hypothetical protein [Bacteroidales bacterium]